MAKKLTAATAGQAKAKSVPYEIPDGGCPGLRLAIQPSGAKSWIVRFRSPQERDRSGKGKARKHTLGPLAEDGEACNGEPTIGRPLTLADARLLATDARHKIRRGIDPAIERRAEKRAARTVAPSNLVEDVFAQFMAKHVRKRTKEPIRETTRRETGRLLGLVPEGEDLSSWIPRTPKRGALAHWVGRDVKSITKRDVLDLLDSIAADAPIAANRTLSALKTAFAWCAKRDILTVSPCVLVDDPSPEASVDRELSGDELVALWRAAERIGYPYGRMVQLLLLTGQRRDEVRAAPRGEFDLAARMWKLPGARAKNGREHHVPLSDAAMAMLNGLPKIKSKAGWLFTIGGDVPVSNLARRKHRLNALMLEERRKIDPEISELAPWRLHDLRHTVKTWMQRARIPKDVRNAVQNHYDGDMDELYGHYSFEVEKRDALDRWARHVAALIDGPAANVVTFPGRGGVGE
jgi:integrase